jgi:hypothetical protein
MGSSSAKGAIHTSLGRRPRQEAPKVRKDQRSDPSGPGQIARGCREPLRIGPLALDTIWRPFLGLRPRLVWIAPLALKNDTPP